MHLGHLCLGSVHVAKYVLQIKSCLEGQHKVAAFHKGQNSSKHCKKSIRDRQDYLFDRDLQVVGKYHSTDAPCYGRLQRYMALEVKLLVGVVPVPDLEQSLHGNTHNILKGSGANASSDKYKNQVIIVGLTYNQHHDAP